jgi:hypothetical protein
MQIVRVYSRIYATCFRLALQGIRHSAWTLLLPIGLWAVLLLAGSLFGRLGMVGGILLALVLDALFSSYLYFTGEIVAQSKARLSELKTSFLAYFWSVVGVAFVVWIAELLLSAVLSANPHAGVIFVMARATAFILCNVTPEVIYQKGTYGGLATIAQSVRFVHENWIEWFIPNVVLSAGYVGLVWALVGLAVPIWIVAIVAGALLHVLMVFRGHLFREFDSGGHRQRMFKWERTER